MVRNIAVAAIMIASMLTACSVEGKEAPVWEPIPGEHFTEVPVTAVEAQPFFADRRDLPETVAAPSPAPRQSKPPKPAPTPRPISRAEKPRPSNHSVSGLATWYCVPGRSRCTKGYPPGLYAAAGSELRVGDWRGRKVQVCAGSKCITVRLIDWCACKGNRIIDLYGAAFDNLAPLGSGVIKVRVSW